MENRELAQRLRETADLMEVAGEDGFRVRSYRKAAEVVETWPKALKGLAEEPKRLQELPGVGRTMAGHLHELLTTGELGLHRELRERFGPGMLEVLNIPGLGPKTAALIWQSYGAGTLEAVEALAKASKLRTLPRMGAKAEEKILNGIALLRQMGGRFRQDQAAAAAAELRARLAPASGVETVEVAGSLRRRRETIGDLDLIVTGCVLTAEGGPAHALVTAPGVSEVLGQGENKVSVRMRDGLQVDMRLMAPESRGAALQYFTGSQGHNVKLRARAQQMGLKLNEYGLIRESDGVAIAGAREEDIYAALGLAWIPPELREDRGEIEAAAEGRLPRLIERGDIRGDIHMHTSASDGRGTIAEMAEAAWARGYGYIAITEHSQALAMANGLNEERMLRHIEAIREAEAAFAREHRGFRILAGVEVDILAEGALDLDDAVLEKLDVVIGSIHSRFDQKLEICTQRLMRAVANPNLDILGHPSGRLLLRRPAYQWDFEAVAAACGEHGVAMEINSAPERLDVDDVQARRCRQLGVKIAINTDAHRPQHLDNIVYGLGVARRAWLEAGDVVNTLPVEGLLDSFHRAPPQSGPRHDG